MTATETDVDAVLGPLDFIPDVPCAVHVDHHGTECGKPAEWLMWLEPRRPDAHCVTACDPHKEAAERHFATCPAHPGVVFCAERIR